MRLLPKSLPGFGDYVGGLAVASVLFQGVSKTYPGGARAVSDLTLRIDQGRFVVLLGPSGCGKTTTLRLVAGLEELTSGEILLADRVVSHLEPKDRDVAMVFQNYALYPHMTVEQNLGFSLKLRRMRRAEIKECVGGVAALLGLEHLLKRRPKALSGGERQRVALGRAIVRRPRVFLFDEPLSNLDAKLRLETRSELKALHQRLGTTTIYVTHDQEEALTLGQQVAVMRDGLLQQFAEPLQVYHRPANRFVAGFVGTPTMNFLDGKLTGGGANCLFEGEAASLPVPSHRAGQLSRYLERSLVLGIRPEHLALYAPDDQEEASADRFRATVHLVEPLGDRSHVHLRTAEGVSLVARVESGQRLAVGDAVGLRVNMSAAHFFEPGPRGENISPGAGPGNS